MKKNLLINISIFFLFLIFCIQFKDIADLLTFGDEAFLIHTAKRMLDGELLYKDISTFFFPGTYYIIYSAFKIFGVSLQSARFVTSLCVAGIGLLLFLITNKIFKNKILSFFSSFIYIILIYSNWYITSYYWFNSFIALVAIILMSSYIEKRYPIYIFLSGFFSGLSFLILQNKGLFLLISLYLFLILRFWFVSENLKNFLSLVKNSKKERLLFILGNIPVFLVFVFWIYYFVPQEMLSHTLFWLFSGYVKNTSPAYFFFTNQLILSILRKIGEGSFYTQIVLFLKTFAYFFLGYSYFIVYPAFLGYLFLTKRKTDILRMNILLLLCLCGAFMFIASFLIKADYHGMLHNVLFTFILSIVYISGYLFERQNHFYKKIPPTVILSVLLIFSLYYASIQIYTIKKLFKYPVVSRIGTVLYSSQDIADEYNEFIAYVEEKIKSGDSFLCLMWCPYYYLLTGKKNLTHFDIIYFGFFPPYYENLFFEEIKKNNSEFLIYDNFPERAKVNPYFYNQLDLDNEALDYIKNNYKIEKRFIKTGIYILKKSKR